MAFPKFHLPSIDAIIALLLTINPSSIARLFFPLKNTTEHTLLTLSDPLGKILRKQAFTTPEFTIERDNLPPGLYLLTISAGRRMLASGKVIFAD